MKNLLLFFIISIMLMPVTLAQSDEELYKKAVTLYVDGDYPNALDVLNKITSSKINTANLRKEIQNKLKTNPGSNVKTKSDQDLFNEAVLLYNNGKYEESLLLLRKISNPNINTGPLQVEINKKLNNRNKADDTKQPGKISEPKLEEKINPETSLKINQGVSLSESNKYTENKPLSKIRTSAKEDSALEETATDLSYGEKSYNKRRMESSGSDDIQNNDNLGGEEIDPGFPFIKYLFGVLLFFSLSIVGFVILKKRSTPNQKIELINLTQNKGYAFNKSEIKIGRAHDNDFVINENGISRYHALIMYDKQGKRFLLKDLNSTNGTIVNGNTTTITELKKGDIVIFSTTNYKIN